jgi:AcrR family transcriptional regulator
MNVNDPPKSERLAQKRRTRTAIVDAAIALIGRGETPTVNSVAAEADVSRRTIYLYFPSFDQLVLDATVGALSQAQVDRAIEQASSEADAMARVEAMVRALHHVDPELEKLGRSLIRLTVDPGTPAVEGTPRRGYRRIEWIEAALSPWREKLAPERFQKLVAALAMVVGWEALIVQRDVCGLSAEAGEELSVWTTRALLKAALEEEENGG